MARAASALIFAAACLTGTLALPSSKSGNQITDKGDFVHRPVHWNGVELDGPKKLSDLSTKAKHHHGAVQVLPHPSPYLHFPPPPPTNPQPRGLPRTEMPHTCLSTGHKADVQPQPTSRRVHP
jgi:hypothetical protein